MQPENLNSEQAGTYISFREKYSEVFYMSQFVEIPASKKSLAFRKPVYGIGINDAAYITHPKVDGKLITCPFYRKWSDMLKRCYSEMFKDKNPTYRACAVCEEWLTFTVFKDWMSAQVWESMELDKDLINPGCKIYSPKNCRFITKQLNTLLTNNEGRRGTNPQGVSFNKRAGKYKSQVSINGEINHIGYYDTPEQASAAYIKIKTITILKAADEQEDPLIANGLRLHAKLLIS